MKKIFIKKINKGEENKGFALLFSVVLSSILLAIALSVANISFKEITFGTSVKDGNDAFFAADTGAGCALIGDRSDSQSFLPPPVLGGEGGVEDGKGNLDNEGGRGIIECLNNEIQMEGGYIDLNNAHFEFVIEDLGTDGKACAKVSVDKVIDSNTVYTHIESKGYNKSKKGECGASSEFGVVERMLILNY